MKPKEHLSTGELSNRETGLAAVAEQLGVVPEIARYYDEYEECTRSIRTSDRCWTVQTNGRKMHLDFGSLSQDAKTIIQHFVINRLHKNAVTGGSYAEEYIRTINVQLPLLLVSCLNPEMAIAYLRTEFFSASNGLPNHRYFSAGKSVLYFFCEVGLGAWGKNYINVLRSTNSPAVLSTHRTVRDGSAIISFEEERRIVAHFDDLNAELLHGTPLAVPTTYLRDACILFWNYAHGMRPIQIANRDIGHVRLRPQKNGSSVIHLTFRYAKQRGAARVMEQTRKMKRDWTPMMTEWLRRRAMLNPAEFDRPNSLFGVSPLEIAKIVAGKTEQIGGTRRLPYDLRHTAAQRKADAGCSRVELAEFLMHQDIETAASYIEMSPTQAEKINQALGLSPLFRAIDKAVKARSVTTEELHDLPDDMQVGAAPHGHLIAGIGGCAIGQSFCTKTPALACYGCSKFMYLRDAEVHRAARQSVQEIVQEFVDAGRTDRVSPAFMQLREVLETIDAIVGDLGPANKEEEQ